MSSKIKKLQTSDNKLIIYYHTIPIYQGKLSNVYFGYATQPNKKGLVVVKIHHTDQKVELYNREKDILSLLPEHINIVKPWKMKLFSSNNAYLIMDYCNMKTLHDLIQGSTLNWFSEEEAITIMKDILKGYKILFDQNIVHDDLTPKNILIHDSIFKISDFGISQIRGIKYKSYLGNMKYTCCQKLLRQQRSYQTSTDIFALGIIFYQLLFKTHPYYNIKFFQFNKSRKNLENSEQDNYCNWMLKQKIEVKIPQNTLNADMYKIIYKMITVKPAQRANFQQIYEIFQKIKQPENRKQYTKQKISRNILESLFQISNQISVITSDIYAERNSHQTFESYSDDNNNSAHQIIELIYRNLFLVEYFQKCLKTVYKQFYLNPYFDKDEIGYGMIARIQDYKRLIHLICYKQIKNAENIIKSNNEVNSEIIDNLIEKCKDKLQKCKKMIELEIIALKQKINSQHLTEDIEVDIINISWVTRDILKQIRRINQQQINATYNLLQTHAIALTKKKMNKLKLFQLQFQINTTKNYTIKQINQLCTKFHIPPKFTDQQQI